MVIEVSGCRCGHHHTPGRAAVPPVEEAAGAGPSRSRGRAPTLLRAMARTNEEPPGGLRRALGLIDAVGIGVGAIVGAGIFVVTGVAAGVAGPAFLLGLLLAGAAAAANALSSAQLAATYPRSGGTYEYGYQVLSPALGFAAGWLFLVSKITAAGTVALGLAGYLEALLPGLPPRAAATGGVLVFTALNYYGVRRSSRANRAIVAGPVGAAPAAGTVALGLAGYLEALLPGLPPRAAATGGVLVFTALNYYGVRRSSRANLAIVAVSVGALLLFVIAGIPSFRMDNLRPFAPAGWGGVLRAAALLFFAYTGYARIATLGEEVREPRRTIPRAIEITIGSVLLLYLAV